jgi:diguanylate cyclase (GGDEF)-like protein
MRLHTKTLVFFSILMGLLVLVLGAISLYSFQRFSLYTAERHARSVAESVKVGLTESMVNGTIGKRPQFLDRLAGVPGVESVRVVRGPAVTKQFGPGFVNERPEDGSDIQVLTRGTAIFKVVDKKGAPVFRATIPYTATSQGIPHCLQCHAVAEGTVLGAISIDIPQGEVKRQAIFATAIISLSVFLVALLMLLALGRLLRPLMDTADAVSHVVTDAVRGSFSGRVKQHSSDEVGEIAGNLNRLMEFLDENLTTIGRRVGDLMGQHHQSTGNQLVATTEMVESLVEASQFKQAIEEDQNKHEVYMRLGNMLSEKYDFHLFSIYEVASSKNRMLPIVVDGEMNAPCRWCDQQILIDASACRAKRTGHEVNAVDFPGLCTMFRDDGKDEKHTHICLPIIQSGTVGCVVQMVIPAEQAQLARLLVPYIAVYLRETAPVLEGKRLMEHLKESSLRDAMTGLYNRRFLEEYVNPLVATNQRRQSVFSILMLDLDYFKQVNDTFGHEAGDKVLKALADILQKSVRSSDMLVRYGGEEFVIVLVDTSAEMALQVAEKIRAKVEETKIPLPGTVLQKTISIGVAEFPTDADSFWQVIKYADVALYEAKSRGRNRVERFMPDMWKETGERY